MNSEATDHAREALASLVADGTLTRAQADAVARRLAGGPPPAAAARPAERAWTSILSEVGGYVGAAFVVAAAVALTGPNWDDLSTGVRFAVLAGPSLAMLAAAGMVAASVPGRWSVHAPAALAAGPESAGPESAGPGTAGPGTAGARRRLVAALIFVAGLLAAGAAAVVAPDDVEPSAAALTALAVLGVGYVACRSPLLHIGTACAAAVGVTALYDLATDRGGQTVPGLLVVAVGVLWAGLSLARVLDEREQGLVVGGLLAFTGAEVVAVQEGGSQAFGYLLLALLAAAALWGYVLLRQVGLLVLGTATLAIVVPQAVIDYSDGALGAAGALLATGLSIVGASVLGLRLHRAEPDRRAAALRP